MQDIKKNGKGDVIRVAKETFKGKDYLDIRIFYEDKHDEKVLGAERLQPTRKGISIPVELAEQVIGAALKELGKK